MLKITSPRNPSEMCLNIMVDKTKIAKDQFGALYAIPKGLNISKELYELSSNEFYKFVVGTCLKYGNIIVSKSSVNDVGWP